MKTYLKKTPEKTFSTSSVFSYSNLVESFLSRSNPRPRIIQPSTKEQQRLLSHSNPSRLQHVHWGKYGIKPIWPEEKSSNPQSTKSSFKESWLSYIFENDQSSSSNSKSDSKKNLFSSLIDRIDESTLIVLFVSLAAMIFLLLLLCFVLNRRQEKSRSEIRSTKKQIRENDFRDHLTMKEDRTSTIRILPTIIEENTAILSTPTKTTNPNSFVDLTENLESEKQDKSTIRKRRSRFEEISETKETNPTHSVIENQQKSSSLHQNVINDEFTSLDQINKAIRDVGVVDSQLIFGIDYTISNLETGKNSFNGLSLHNIQNGLLNPYQSVITIVGRTLERFDSDSLIPAFGFGDRATLDRKIFPLRPDGNYCKGFRGVLEAYNEITPKVRMSGPTNFAPLIREAIRIVKKTRQYHILVIVADGQVTNERQTKDAIVEASNYPLSIVMIGVGDGPWDMMKEFDDSLPARQFDNFQFVNYNSIVQAANDSDSTFALQALMEIPSQYAAIKKLGLLQDK